MFNIKADPKIPHHYIIVVAMHGLKSGVELRGKVFLKYRPIYYHHSDIINAQLAAMLSVDKVFKTTSEKASEVFNCQELVMAITGLKYAANANEATLHHFSSEFKIPDADEWFKSYVKNSNTIESIRRQLDEARMPGY